MLVGDVAIPREKGRETAAEPPPGESGENSLHAPVKGLGFHVFFNLGGSILGGFGIAFLEKKMGGRMGRIGGKLKLHVHIGVPAWALFFRHNHVFCFGREHV